jgi:hypothetical protein
MNRFDQETTMLPLETVAEIHKDGTLKAQAPTSIPEGTRRVVIVFDESDVAEKAPRRRLLDLSGFRTNLKGSPYPGNSVVDMRSHPHL